MEYIVGNREHYVKEKDGEKIFGGGERYVVFFLLTNMAEITFTQTN